MHPKKSKIFQGTPFIPLSLARRGGGKEKEGRQPLLKLLSPSPLEEGGQGDGVLNNLYMDGWWYNTSNHGKIWR